MNAHKNEKKYDKYPLQNAKSIDIRTQIVQKRTGAVDISVYNLEQVYGLYARDESQNVHTDVDKRQEQLQKIQSNGKQIFEHMWTPFIKHQEVIPYLPHDNPLESNQPAAQVHTPVDDFLSGNFNPKLFDDMKNDINNTANGDPIEAELQTMISDEHAANAKKLQALMDESRAAANDVSITTEDANGILAKTA